MQAVFWLVVLTLATPALLITGSRVTDTDVGTLIRIEAFTPIGLPLYAALLVLLAAGAARRRRDGWRVRAVGAVLALVGLGLHAWWFSPQVLGDNPSPAPGAAHLVVMNANLYEGRGDPADVVGAVRDHHVDVLVLEEITPIALEKLDDLGLADLLPNRIGEPDPDVAGTMVFSDQPLGTPALLNTQFRSYRVTVGSLTLLAVHPVAPVDPPAWRRDHDVIRNEAVSARADLVVGDMNATPDHDVMRELDDAGFRDAGELANVGWQPTWPANHVSIFPLLPPLVRIDHVLVADTLASLGTETVDIEGSDHNALIATVAARG